MECACIRHTELPHTSRLFTDFIYHFDRVHSFYPLSPHQPESYQAAARQIDFPDDRRAALVAALRVQNGNSASLDLLAQRGTLAVVTGQQVGLYSGPSYTIYKALTAIKVARELSSRGIRAVPIFWLATEDHDFAEINHCWVFNAAHRPVRLEANGSQSNHRPVGLLPVNQTPLDQLKELLGAFPFGAEILNLIDQTYREGATYGSAFSALLKRLLAQYDLLHVDPMHPVMRELAAPLLRAALAAAPELTSLLLARNKELESRGYHAQVHVEDQTSLVFLLEGGRRIALRRHEREYLANGRRFSTEELMDNAAHLSPNALMRPVVQDFILPTVAYVGGPAELAYLAQAEVLYHNLLGRMPVALNRSSFTLLDRRAAKLMDRYRLGLSDFFHGDEALRERIAAKLIPPALGRAMEEAKATADRARDRLAFELASFDPTLAAALEKSRQKINYQLSKIERKIAREALRRDVRAAEHSSYLASLIYPQKHLQERLYSLVPFLAKHGLDLIDRLYDNVPLDCPDHQLLVI